jgi:hypothetical protein
MSSSVEEVRDPGRLTLLGASLLLFTAALSVLRRTWRRIAWRPAATRPVRVPRSTYGL